MHDQDIEFLTLKKWVSKEKKMLEALSETDLIQTSLASLTKPTRSPTAPMPVFPSSSQSSFSITAGLYLTLQEKAALMSLLREMIRNGGLADEREKIYEAALYVEEEAHQAKDPKEREESYAEEEAERLIWIIEKSYGKSSASLRETQRKMAEMEKEIERMKEEKRIAIEHLEQTSREKQQIEKEKEECERKKEAAEQRLAQLEDTIKNSTLDAFAISFTDISKLQQQGNKIIHHGSGSNGDTCTVVKDLSKVCFFIVVALIPSGHTPIVSPSSSPPFSHILPVAHSLSDK